MGKTPIMRFMGEAVAVFAELQQQFRTTRVWSSSGNRNGIHLGRAIVELAQFFNQNGVSWHESPADGIIRGLKNRTGWSKHWYNWVSEPPARPDLHQLRLLEYPPSFPKQSVGKADVYIPENTKPDDALLNAMHDASTLPEANSCFQPGGSRAGRRYLQSFLTERAEGYRRLMSETGSSPDKLFPPLTLPGMGATYPHGRFGTHFSLPDKTALLKEI